MPAPRSEEWAARGTAAPPRLSPSPLQHRRRRRRRRRRPSGLGAGLGAGLSTGLSTGLGGVVGVGVVGAGVVGVGVVVDVVGEVSLPLGDG